MDHNPQRDYSSILVRLATIALYIVLGAGISAIAIGYIVITSGSSPGAENKLIRNILFVVSLLELATLQFIKRSMIAKIDLVTGTDEAIYGKLLSPTLVIAAICSGISIYGLITVILGSPLEVLLLFVAISLIGFQVLRIRSRDLSK